MIELSSYIIFPMMIGLGLIAGKLVPFLFTEKWNTCIPIFIFACISYGVNPFRTINIQLIYAIGDSKRSLFVECVRTFLLITGTILCVFVFKTSIYGIPCVSASVSVINVLITQFFAKKYIDYGYKEWILDMLPAIKICLGMAVLVYAIGLLPLHRYVLMFVQIAAGGIAYIGLSIAMKNHSYFDIKNMIAEKIHGKHNMLEWGN